MNIRLDLVVHLAGPHEENAFTSKVKEPQGVILILRLKLGFYLDVDIALVICM